MIKNVRRGDTIVTSGGIIGKVTKVVDDGDIEVEIADGVRVKVARAHDRRGPRQGRAGQGLSRPAGRAVDERSEKLTHAALLDGRRSSRTLGVIVVGLLLARAEPVEPRAARRRSANRSRPGFRPGSCRPARSCSASTCRAARTCCSRSTCSDLLRTPGRRSCATTSAASCARRGVDPQGGIQLMPRGVQLRVPDAGRARHALLPKLRELSQPIGNAAPRPDRRRDVEVTEQRRTA